MRLLVDTSVLVKWLKADDRREADLDKALLVLDSIRDGRTDFYLLDLSFYELANALLFSKKAKPDDVAEFLDNLAGLSPEIIRVDDSLVNAAYKTAQNKKLTVYDATFIAGAERVGAKLVTANPKHQRKDLGCLRLSEFSAD